MTKRCEERLFEATLQEKAALYSLMLEATLCSEEWRQLKEATQKRIKEIREREGKANPKRHEIGL